MLLKVFQAAEAAKIISLPCVLMFSRSPAGNDIHSTHKIFHRGFWVGVGLHNREAGVAFVFHPILVFIWCFPA